MRAGSVRHIAAFGNAVLEIIPLRLCIGPIFAARRFRRVGLDRQRATLLRKLARLRKTKDPSFRKHTWPRFGGAFLSGGGTNPRTPSCFWCGRTGEPSASNPE